MEPFLPYDDPEFARVLGEVVQSSESVEDLLEQATHSDELLAFVDALTRQADTLLETMAPSTALRVMVLIAFTQGYRTAARMTG